MKTRAKVAVFMDLANGRDLDLNSILDEAGKLGRVEVLRAYGDFRQEHLYRLALELYAAGVEMVHCPSWSNGNGTGSMKRSDDRLLEKGVRDLLVKRPSISTYVLATADADIIPTCHSIRENGKRVVLCNSMSNSLGWVLRLCGFEILQVRDKSVQEQKVAPKTSGKQNTDDAAVKTRNREPKPKEPTREELIRQIARLEETNRYLTFMRTVTLLAAGDQALEKGLRQQLSELVKGGVMESYQYQIPAIRLNRANPMVVAALDDEERAQATESANGSVSVAAAAASNTGENHRRKVNGDE